MQRQQNAVEGHRVPRYGTPQFIGWVKRPRRKVSPEVVDASTGRVTKPAKFEEGGRQLECNPDLIVALTHGEWGRYSRLYGKRFAEGSLKERTEQEYASQGAAPSAQSAPKKPKRRKES